MGTELILLASSIFQTVSSRLQMHIQNPDKHLEQVEHLRRKLEAFSR